jgi:hypothetical protein
MLTKPTAAWIGQAQCGHKSFWSGCDTVQCLWNTLAGAKQA